LQEDLAARVKLFHRVAANMGIELLSSELSPVQYVLVGEFDRVLPVAKAVMDDGFFVSCCAYPAVAKNHSGLRLTLSRHVSETDVHAVLDSIRRALRDVGGIPAPARTTARMNGTGG
jgi:7-keto-8-aminopelargonate synthetase-like enzyme